MPPIPDGSRWTAENAANNAANNGANHGANHAAPARISGESIQRLIVLGYITAIAMPPVGLILGLWLAVRLDKRDSRRGMWIIAISVIAAIAWVLALVVGLLSPNFDTAN
jgi:hypothetical protein